MNVYFIIRKHHCENNCECENDCENTLLYVETIVKYSLVQDVKGDQKYPGFTNIVSLEPCKDQARQVTTSRGVITKVRQATISNDVIAKSETTMWLSQIHQATISGCDYKGDTSNHID